MGSTPKTFEDLSFVRLEDAVLCADCEMISNSAECCFACGSSALIRLTRVLGGPVTAGPTAILIESKDPEVMPEAVVYSPKPRHVRRRLDKVA